MTHSVCNTGQLAQSAPRGHRGGNFDGSGYTFPGEELPSGRLEIHGIAYLFPAATAGAKNNIAALGQRGRPGPVLLTLNNTDGPWPSRKPHAPYYGRIGRDPGGCRSRSGSAARTSSGRARCMSPTPASPPCTTSTQKAPQNSSATR
ncbi:hypothetical protein ACFYXH_36070 [Streptomyces sp. NPDC002730]|uniref:hypothetical protein n=1 Tax=Streptomyces sp. NPDC002730 TaxID=3364662 RepID=UPI0036BA0249